MFLFGVFSSQRNSIYTSTSVFFRYSDPYQNPAYKVCARLHFRVLFLFFIWIFPFRKRYRNRKIVGSVHTCYHPNAGYLQSGSQLGSTWIEHTDCEK